MAKAFFIIGLDGMTLRCRSRPKTETPSFHEAFPKAHQIYNRSRYVDVDGTGRYTSCLKPYDLLINDLGNILFPSNLYSHCVKCVVYIGLILSAQEWWLRMSWIWTWSAIAAVVYSYRRILMALIRRNKPWLDSTVVHVSNGRDFDGT